MSLEVWSPSAKNLYVASKMARAVGALNIIYAEQTLLMAHTAQRPAHVVRVVAVAVGAVARRVRHTPLLITMAIAVHKLISTFAQAALVPFFALIIAHVVRVVAAVVGAVARRVRHTPLLITMAIAVHKLISTFAQAALAPFFALIIAHVVRVVAVAVGAVARRVRHTPLLITLAFAVPLLTSTLVQAATAHSAHRAAHVVHLLQLQDPS
jgi:hypothetical protein